MGVNIRYHKKVNFHDVPLHYHGCVQSQTARADPGIIDQFIKLIIKIQSFFYTFLYGFRLAKVHFDNICSLSLEGYSAGYQNLLR